MAVTIEITFTDEFNEQVELFCSLNSTNKYAWISGLLHDD